LAYKFKNLWESISKHSVRLVREDSHKLYISKIK